MGQLAHFLEGYSKAAYLVQGFSIGFTLAYTGPRTSSTAPNLKTCLDHPDIVQLKIESEVWSGRIRGPFSDPPFPDLHISPIGLVPKKTPGQYRLIHHLSYPCGSSINDFIDPIFSAVKYASFDDATTLLLSHGRGSYLAKTDIENGFRIIPVHWSDHNLLGFMFKGQYYYDTCLPMGISSACAIFEHFSTGLQWIAQHKLNIPSMVHILDDFLFISSNFPSCKANLDQFMALCSTVGVPLKAEKTEQPKQVITFMGLELDLVTMEARLPMDKLVKLRSLLSSTSKSRKIKLKDLQSLLGLLNFCCQVIVPGRCFLRRLTDLTKKVSKPNHRFTLTRESRKDIQAWLLFLQSFNGKQLLVEQRWVHNTALHLHTDASGNIGFGAIFGSHWLYSAWPPKLAHLHITYKELFPIVVALVIWGMYRVTYGQCCCCTYY